VPPLIIRKAIQTVYPGTVDITNTFYQYEDVSYSYWLNNTATIPIPDPTKIGKKAIYYIKSVTSAGCISVTPVPVDILIPDIVIPNTFSPNSDGVNDVLTILINSTVLIKYFKIFNRWGDVVYITADINNYWSGFKQSSEVPVGVYYWVIEGILDSKRYLRSGYVTLVR
jgi:gliding motility-associated-like protein